MYTAAWYREGVMTKAAWTCDAGRPSTEHTMLQLHTGQLPAPDCAASAMTTSASACAGL